MSEFSDYIAAKKGSAPQGGDFAAYLRAKGVEPAKPVEPSHDIPLGVKAPEAEPGFFARAFNTAKEGVHAVKEAGGDILETRGASLLDPAKRHQLERGISDVVTGGLGTRLAGWVGDKLGDTGEANLNQTEASDAVKAPEYRATGNVAGMFLPSPIGKLGGAVAGKVLAPVAAKATGKLAGAGVGIARSLLGYEASAVPLAATQAISEGGNPIEAARAAATDPLGLIMSVGGGAIGGAGRGVANEIRDPAKLSGQVLESVARDNGQIKTFGKDPIRGGGYELTAEAGLKEGRAGMNELAGQKEAEIKDYNREKLAERRKAHGEGLDAILSEHAQEPTTPQKTTAALDEMAARSKLSNGKVANKSLHKFVQDMRDLISTETDQIDREHLKATGEAKLLTKPEVLVEDLIKLKQTANDHAEWGSPATKDNAPYRLISKALAEDAAAVDPRIAELNKTYGQTMEELKDANDILYGKRAVDVADSAAKSKGASLKLGRIGDETQAGTTDRLDELRKLDPKYEQVARELERKKNVERLRYGEPEVSTGFEKGQHRAAGHAARHAVGKVIGGALGLHLGGPAGAIAGALVPGAASAMFQNPLARDLRLRLPLAEGIGGRINGVRAGLSALAIAREEQRRIEAQRAAAARGGL